ncbi:unnamed protein product [Rotaria socialis]|uniref:BAH domain-containing protein n=2 Tax=Rotaria socialis TaxID=392032 RepID=A0A818ILC0_9BILA|nr:unnamed protein product [Rotaria socialis]CAF3527082.1 unnamed protein product [Rotaria socialis]CAF4324854.1 unnamed protein product [Rotaria socialis]
MRAVTSSSYSSPTLSNIMIPQFQQLLPLETSLSGSWLNNHCTAQLLSTNNKLLSPPISITPSSICTDLSESEYQPIDLSSARKYSLPSPPLSNIKSESIDVIDCASPYCKQDSTMIISKHEKSFFEQSQSSCETIKQCSNFSIEYILSTSYRPPTYELLRLRSQNVNSIFTKKKTKHYSDNYLHRIINYRKQRQQEKQYHVLRDFNPPRGIFIGHILDLYNDLIHQRNQIKIKQISFTIDALEQLADIACKLDTRHKKSILNEKVSSSKTYEILFKQCHLLIKQNYQKYQHKKIRKRLYFNPKANFKDRFLHFSLSILNILQMEKNLLLYGSYHSDCHILMPNIHKNFIELKRIKPKVKQSVCVHLKVDQIASNFEILLPNHGLLYEAIIQKINSYDDLLLVRLHDERQTYLIPTHDLCQLACPKVIPENFDILSKGSRVCAYWSTSLRGLHPAVVKTIPLETNKSSMVTLLFDDGDTGLIKLGEIRLLPDDYVIKGINLEEWRVSSSQILPILSISQRSSRRSSSTTSLTTNSSSKRIKIEKPACSSTVEVPQWTLNIRNSSICRHDTKQVLRVGDCVVLHGVDKSLSYIGKVLKFYRNKSTQQDLVRLKWYYSPQETPIGLHKNDLPGGLYESTHIDENPIATIRYKGTIYGSYDDYVKNTDYGKKRQETDFYLLGQYNPISGDLKRYDDESLQKKKTNV